MKWPLIPLASVVMINPKDDDHRHLPDDTPISFIPMSAVSEDGFGIVNRAVKSLHDVRRGYSTFKDDDVLFAKITPCMENGKSAIATDLVNGRGFGSTEFHVLRPGPRIMPAFLHYYIRRQSFRTLARQHMRGGVGQQRVPADFLSSEAIPLPPLHEQRRIVDLLDQVDRLRRLRAQADTKAARVLPALFAGLFGDPVTNPMKWPRKRLGEMGQLARGLSRHRPRNDPLLLGGPYPLIQTGDVARSGGRITEYSQTYSEAGLAQSKLWPSGTLCITIAANISMTGVLEFDACFPDSVVGFVPNHEVATEYVQFLLARLRGILDQNAPHVAQKNINLKVLRSLDVPVPPIELQQIFASYVRNHYEHRSQQVSTQAHLDRLLDTMTTRSFFGCLTMQSRSRNKELPPERSINTCP